MRAALATVAIRVPFDLLVISAEFLEHSCHAGSNLTSQSAVSIVDWRLELERLHTMSFAWALHCCGHRRDEAEELLQEVYIRVLDGRARFAGRASMKTWLFGVILRTARELARKGWLRIALLERWHRSDPGRDPPPDAARGLDESRQSSRLSAALARLSRRQREVLHLVFYQDLTVEESAEMLGISLGSARTHFERGKQRLRGLLQENDAP
jgi:RNA polymerase sigma factor (sigma-70 family)